MRLPKLINDSNRPLIIIMSIVVIGIWVILAIASPKDIMLDMRVLNIKQEIQGFQSQFR